MSPPPSPRPGLARTAANLAVTLVIGGAGGFAASVFNLPLAFMLGSMFAVLAAALAGLPVVIPMWLRLPMLAVLGVLLGSTFKPDLFSVVPNWWPAFVALPFYVLIGSAVSYLWLRRKQRTDRTTAFFASPPGGMTEMIIIGTGWGGDSRFISLVHATRILVVVTVVPFAVRLLLGVGGDASAPRIAGNVAWPAPPDVALLVASGLAGYGLARLMNWPAKALLGPLAGSAVVHLAGFTADAPPQTLVAIAQVVIGAGIGCRFAGAPIAELRRPVFEGIAIAILILAVSAAFTALVAPHMALPTLAVFLAFAPGGLAEMMLIALAIDTDTAFVATLHAARIIVVMVAMPLAARRILGRPAAGGGD
ncbi:AbrB family transcriptional regulator [Futiania mangrovi]|uniref:AbrB family transcriptional regulator n=1 Tax=Futiania mangrovi TaxID=2959716 RepID=A0A9J6PBH9_9PROT|nr:AbrB family transcriptional regulator [Futiania mangrovii]MCP1335080.1 AbrB family transcriptional regulator [Futiania mangrovii]